MQFPSADGTMRMNGDGDFVFVAELVDAVKAVRRGIGAHGLDAERFAILKNLLVGVVIVGKLLDAIADWRDLIVSTELQQRLNLVGAGVGRSVLLVKLDVVQAEVLSTFQRRLGVKIAKAIALHAEGKSAEALSVFLVRV